MSIKKEENLLLEKLDKIYPNNKIKIIDWNGYTKPITYTCDLCNKNHTVSDARQLINKNTYCIGKKTNKLFSLPEYQARLNSLHSENIEIIEYSGLSNPVKYYCPRCHQIKSCSPARNLLTKLSLCDACYGVERNIVKRKIDDLFNKSNEYEMITWRGVKQKMSIKHNICGNVYKRYPSNVLVSFNSCPFCDNGSTKNRMSVEEAQKKIDLVFGEGEYKILDYKGQLHKSTIKCLNCNEVFDTQLSSFIISRGCIRCKRKQSKGEQLVKKYLEENHIKFEEQKRFSDCNNNLSSFDFAVYDQDNIMHLIEVNGIQHYVQTDFFEDLKTIQRRDQLKINYCKGKNIDLIIIPYTKLTIPEIDNFLAFLKGSTTIPSGSREQALSKEIT